MSVGRGIITLNIYPDIDVLSVIFMVKLGTAFLIRPLITIKAAYLTGIIPSSKHHVIIFLLLGKLRLLPLLPSIVRNTAMTRNSLHVLQLHRQTIVPAFPLVKESQFALVHLDEDAGARSARRHSNAHGGPSVQTPRSVRVVREALELTTPRKLPLHAYARVPSPLQVTHHARHRGRSAGFREGRSRDGAGPRADEGAVSEDEMPGGPLEQPAPSGCGGGRGVGGMNDHSSSQKFPYTSSALPLIHPSPV
mmetsp:Transcript_43830/g.133442  ORF Transcript_43830/g.133442 Transcript_43830/m.133442 type:complete len:250 (-) Transcript_43830:40-789(-)